MAKAPEPNDAAAASTNSAAPPKRRMLMWIVLLIVAAGLGVGASLLIPGQAVAESETEKTLPVTETPADEDLVVVSFGDVTVNLAEGRMNRYMRLKLALLVPKAEETAVNTAVTDKKALLRNWLLSHLSDKTLDEIRGKAGQNMLRREIRSEFNEVLFPDRRDRVLEILFEEFNVQ